MKWTAEEAEENAAKATELVNQLVRLHPDFILTKDWHRLLRWQGEYVSERNRE
jgi:hypothetical protein